MSDSFKTRGTVTGKLCEHYHLARGCSDPFRHIHQRPHMRHSISLIALVATTAMVGHQPASAIAPVPPLSAISFMTGCWTGASSNGATIEERYSETADNLMIGMTRYVRGSRIVDFEFTTVSRTDSSFVMTPHPKGVKSDPFPLKEVADGRAVWENLKHDFPQRIIYRSGTDGSLIARIEGKTPRGESHREWTMHRCSR